MAALPIVDLSLAEPGSPTRPQVAATLLHALETIGFFYVTGVKGYDEKKLLDLSKWLFYLPKEEKMKMAKKCHVKENPNLYKGYFPETPTIISHKEGFELIQEPENKEGLPGHPIFYEPNVWPEGLGERCTWFKEGVLEYYDMMQKTGIQLLSLLAEALGLNTNWWDPMMKPWSLSCLRLMRYPRRYQPPPPEAIEGDKVLQCEEHTDSGLLTLLSTFDFTGLQVRDGGGSKGEWKDVPPLPNHLVVNIGDMMSDMSGRRFTSTKHRVLDMGVERFSTPFFFEPAYTADISPRPEFVREGAKIPKTSKISYGEFCIQKMTVLDEYKDLVKLMDPNYDYSKVRATVTESTVEA